MNIRRIVLVVFALMPMVVLASPKHIWIDTDLMLGKAHKDVDDGIALIMALQSNDVVIDGISLEGDVDYAYDMANKLVQRYGRGRTIPILKGAHNIADGGKKTDAVEGLAASLRKHKTTIVGIGPVTNIATMLLLYPELKDSVQGLVLCMGRRPNMHFNPGNGKKNMNDYNFDLDPHAAEYLMTTGIPVVLCGYEAASTVYLNKHDYGFLKASGDKTDKWLYKQFKHWSTGWKLFFGSHKGFIPFDAVTITYVLQPDLLQVDRKIPVDVTVMENDSRFGDFGEEKDYLIVGYDIQADHVVDYCHGVVSPAGKDFIVNSLKQVVSK